MLNPILFAVPVFLAMMLIEYAIERRRGQPVYRAGDTVASLSLGVISQLVGLFTRLLALGIYTLVWQQWAIWPLPLSSVWVWLGALLAYDFFYYWLHRMGHEVRLLWAAHAVHHSSEEYNLSTALRQTSSGFLFGWIFYLPMAVVGVPPLVFVTVGLIDLLYQFWVHTRQVGKLGWFDRVFCSPSNHRVHHGQNDYCVDRNYGGILILWDRLFGSFAEERDNEPIVYGIRGALRSFNPWHANLQIYAGMWQDMRLAARWTDKLRVLYKHPGWRPADAAAQAPRPSLPLAQFKPFEPPLPAVLKTHALVQLAVLIAFFLQALALGPRINSAPGLAFAALIVVQLIVLSRLSERGLAAWRSELLRWLLGAAALALSPWHGLAWWLLWAAAGAAGAWALAMAARPTRSVPRAV